MLDYINNINKLLRLKEDIHCELIFTEKDIPFSFYETYSSFANTGGGEIYLGISNDQNKSDKIIGFTLDIINTMIKDIYDTLNNKSKVSNNILNENDFEIIQIDDDKYILCIHIPEAKDSQKPIFLDSLIENSYKRNQEFDYKMSPNELISCIAYRDNSSFDVLVNTQGYSFNDINLSSLKEYRNILNSVKPNNIFYSLDNYEFMKSFNLLRLDHNGNHLLTNNAVLFFGKESIIRSIYSDFFLDYQEHLIKNKSYSYRITSDDLSFSGNLFDFFNIVLERLSKTIRNEFEDDDMTNISNHNMYTIIREALINAICNADYYNYNSIIIHRYPEKIIFENSGHPILSIDEMIHGNISRPRNKELIRLFRSIGYCDRDRHGIKEINNIANKIKLPTPVIEKLDSPYVTRLTIFTPSKEINEISNSVSSKELLSYIGICEKGISIKDLAIHFNVSTKTMSNLLNKLVISNLLKTNDKQTKGKLYFIK